MIVDCAIYLLGLTVLLCTLLCAGVLIAMWKRRRSRMLNSFYYRCCWNESWINLFTLIFFITTMYVRFFPIINPTCYYLNRFKWWTKFAQITQEHFLYIQILNVFLTVGGRFCTICLPHSGIAQTAEQMKKWKIFILQTFLPTLTVIPLYCIGDHAYGFKGVTMPLWLSAMDPSYEKAIYIIAFIYRSLALVLSFAAYICMFYLVRKKANRNETRILFHGGSLLSALLASLICTIVEGLDIGSTAIILLCAMFARMNSLVFSLFQDHALMRVFYFTTFLWVPCTDIVTTFWIVVSLRSIISPFQKVHRTSITNSKNIFASYHQ